jgi:hypothetical protein
MNIKKKYEEKKKERKLNMPFDGSDFRVHDDPSAASVGERLRGPTLGKRTRQRITDLGLHDGLRVGSNRVGKTGNELATNQENKPHSITKL